MYRSIPLTSILKACQFTKDNIIDILHNHWIHSSSSVKGAIFFNKYEKQYIHTILNWIKTDGHLQIHSSHIEIVQKTLSYDKLVFLKDVFLKAFKLREKSAYIGKSNSWDGYYLSISSAPLRYILNIIYKIPLGYKTHSMIDDITFDVTKLSRKHQIVSLAAFCESEGSFSTNITHGKFISPRFEFKVHDKSLAYSCYNNIRSLNYKVKMYYNKKKRDRQGFIYK